MNFGKAIKRCMKGAKITRKDWNGKGQFVFYTPGRVVLIEDWVGETTQDERKRENVIIAGHFDMYNAQGIRIIGWVPTQTDMTSDEWEIYGTIEEDD